MRRWAYVVASVWWTAWAAVAAPAEPVTVRVEPMTFPVRVADTVSRGSKTPGTGWYILRGTEKTIDRTVDVVKLDNGLVEAWVVPAWAGRLIRAVDKQTGTDYFRWGDGVFEGHLAWSRPGGVKPSFPFFEHGTHLEQPAGYRVVRHPDGSATVAMDLRFTQHTTPADSQRYGRFCDEALNIMVSLRPGSAVVEWRQRKENPNPLPRAERMWNDTLYPVALVQRKATVKGKDGKEEEKLVADQDAMRPLTTFIYPARWVADHGPTTLHTSPHWSNPDNWNVSHFAIDAPYHFVGVFDVKARVNRLRINDDQGPAAKIYTNFADFCEHWGGVGYVFEKPGKLRPAYEPVEFTHRFWTAEGIGLVSYANADVAVSVDGGKFELVSSSERTAKVVDGAGETVAEGKVGPHAVLSGTFDGKLLVVTSDGRELMRQSFPLDRPTPSKDAVPPADVKAKYDAIVASADLEGEMVAHNEGVPRAFDGIKANPRLAYRFGDFDTALNLLGDAATPDADYLRGLIAWERGEPVDFKSAGWQAGYMRALQSIQRGDKASALKWVDGYLEHVPNAWYPRLARAYWSNDAAAAQRLADENPGSPEAQLVLKLLGRPSELDLLLKNNPDADKHVSNFEAQLTRGEWRHLPRYPVPQKK